MNLEDATPGTRVSYTGRHRQGTEFPDLGTVTSTNDTYVFVRYDMNPNQAQATRPEDLTPERQPTQP